MNIIMGVVTLVTLVALGSLVSAVSGLSTGPSPGIAFAFMTIAAGAGATWLEHKARVNSFLAEFVTRLASLYVAFAGFVAAGFAGYGLHTAGLSPGWVFTISVVLAVIAVGVLYWLVTRLGLWDFDV